MSFKRVYIEITNVCNLNCSFCSPSTKPKRHMSIPEIEHILKDLSFKDAHIYPHIKGEPLMHPKFKEFIGLIDKYNYNLNITTNGVFIKKYKDLLLKYARQVNISVHALLDGQIKDKETYIKDIIDFGLCAKQKGAPNVSYRLWLEEKDKAFSDESYEILKILGNAFNMEITRNIEKGRNAVKLADNIYISLMNKFTWPTLSKDNERKFGNCLGGKDMIGILSDGTVVPCCLDSLGIINLGNIFTDNISDILKSERFINLVDGFSGKTISENLCKKCTFYDTRKK